MSSDRELHSRAAASVAELGAIVIERRRLRHEMQALSLERDAWQDENEDANTWHWPRRKELRQMDDRFDILGEDLVELAINALGCALLAMSAPEAELAGKGR